jgi:copper chaperone
MEKGTIKLEGIRSQQDADKILQAINKVWGVRKAEVNVNSREAVISYDEMAASFQDFEQAIVDMGFDVERN